MFIGKYPIYHKKVLLFPIHHRFYTPYISYTTILFLMVFEISSNHLVCFSNTIKKKSSTNAGLYTTLHVKPPILRKQTGCPRTKRIRKATWQRSMAKETDPV